MRIESVVERVSQVFEMPVAWIGWIENIDGAGAAVGDDDLRGCEEHEPFR